MAKGVKTGGRRKGTPNKFTRDVRSMVLNALDAVGGEEYLQTQANENPQAFLGLLGKTLPKDVNVNGGVLVEVTLVRR